MNYLEQYRDFKKHFVYKSEYDDPFEAWLTSLGIVYDSYENLRNLEKFNAMSFRARMPIIVAMLLAKKQFQDLINE